MLPIETVLELLMVNTQEYHSEFGVCPQWIITLDAGTIGSDNEDELRSKIRTYLESLVPAQKLLSECEEFEYVACQYQPGISVMRDGEFAYEADGTCGGLAKDFTVVQPVEVNRE